MIPFTTNLFCALEIAAVVLLWFALPTLRRLFARWWYG